MRMSPRNSSGRSILLRALPLLVCAPSIYCFSSQRMQIPSTQLKQPLCSRSSSSLNPRSFHLQLRSANQEDDANQTRGTPDLLVAETSLGLKRVSWLSWWSQMILTVTSSVILVFAKNVVTGMRDAQVNFLLAGCGTYVLCLDQVSQFFQLALA